MIKTRIPKLLPLYIILLFHVLSFLAHTYIYPRQGLKIYYIINTIFFTGMIVLKVDILKFFKWPNKTIVYSFIIAYLLSNLVLFYVSDSVNSSDLKEIVINLLLFGSIRTFGEELIFRGPLLIKKIQKNNILFWCLNILLASIFTFIHSTFMDDWLIFTTYVFLFSIFVAWMNRKHGSLLPSWIFHWMNGKLCFVFYFIYGIS